MILPQNSKGEKVVVPAHGGTLDIQGTCVAKVNDKLQIESIEVWFDPMAMFRQMHPPKDAEAEKAAATEQAVQA
jgi:hypothetical protein